MINDSIPANSQGNVFSNPWGNATRVQCGDPYSATGFTSGPFHYKVYRVRNVRGWWSGGVHTWTNTCVNVSLLVHSGSAAASLYGVNFNPGCPGCAMFGSVGGLGPGQGGDFSGYVSGEGAGSSTPPPPLTFDVVVYETIPNGGASYTLLVEGTGIIQTSGGTPTAADGIQSFRVSSAPKGVLVRWRTRSEHEALGFNLYRGTTKKFRLTGKLVRTSGDGRGHTYSYLDRSARKGKTGPYYLEVVHRNGSKIMFGPARKTAG